jgi:hypothetical protein
MTAVLMLAILVASGEGESPATSAMVAAASEALGAGGDVRLSAAATPSDAEALRVESAMTARAVAQLLWLDDAHAHARLRVHVARTDRWVDRAITFDAADSLRERGRTLGFAIASMLPEADPTLQPVDAAPANEPVSAALPAEPTRRHAVALAVTATDGIAGTARAFGGDGAVSFVASDWLSPRLTLGLRGGSLDGVSATVLTARAGVGAAWTPLAPDANRAFGLSLGVDALVIYQAVAHVHPSGQKEWQAKVLPGADALLEASLRLGRGVEVTLAGGPEIALGTVDVTIVAQGTTREATLPALRALAQAGLRFRF